MSYVRHRHSAMGATNPGFCDTDTKGKTPCRIAVCGTADKKTGVSTYVNLLAGQTYTAGKNTGTRNGKPFSEICAQPGSIKRPAVDNRTTGPHVANSGNPGITKVDHRTPGAAAAAATATPAPVATTVTGGATDPGITYDPTSYGGGTPTDQELDQLIGPTDPVDYQGITAPPAAPPATPPAPAPDTIMGLPKTVVYIGAAGLAAYFLFMRK